MGHMNNEFDCCAVCDNITISLLLLLVLLRQAVLVYASHLVQFM